MTDPADAILAAEAAEAETAYRNELARESYGIGRTAGYTDGYARARAEMAQAWREAAGLAARGGPSNDELQARRWGPGGREHFADPRPGDYPGRGKQPEPEREAEAG